MKKGDDSLLKSQTSPGKALSTSYFTKSINEILSGFVNVIEAAIGERGALLTPLCIIFAAALHDIAELSTSQS
jgi:hypothetical protein